MRYTYLLLKSKFHLFHRYTMLQQNHCMENRGKSTFCIVNSNKTYTSTVLADLIYGKVEKNQVLRTESVKQELCKSEKRE